jgi:site-specific recombinase XerD
VQGTCKAVDAVKANHLRAFLVHLEETDHNAGGRHQYYRTLKAFFRWLLAEGIIENNPMERIKPPKLLDTPLPPVPIGDVQAMLKTCDKSLLGQRDRAILMALLDSGCPGG